MLREYRNELRWLPRGLVHVRYCRWGSCGAQAGTTRAGSECSRIDEYLDLAVRERRHPVPAELMEMFHSAACREARCSVHPTQSSGKCRVLSGDIQSAVRYEIEKWRK